MRPLSFGCLSSRTSKRLTDRTVGAKSTLKNVVLGLVAGSLAAGVEITTSVWSWRQFPWVQPGYAGIPYSPYYPVFTDYLWGHLLGWTVALVLLIAVCLSTQSHANSDNCATVVTFVSLGDVLADAAKYDGKEIIVRGSYRMVIHGSVLMMSSCPANLVNLRQAKGYVENQSALKIIRSNTRKGSIQDDRGCAAWNLSSCTPRRVLRSELRTLRNREPRLSLCRARRQ